MGKELTTRRAVTEGLFELAETDASVVLVSSDSLGVIKAQDFKEKYPHRVFEIGISEQAAMSGSAGLASTGLKPYYVSYAVFATMRACEQLRTMIAYPHLPVRIVGANGGMGAGEREGVSHQGLEDIGILRTFPGLTILVPSDAEQVKQAIVAANSIDGPVYIRVGSGKEKQFFTEKKSFSIGKTKVLADYGTDIVLFTCGFVIHEVAAAADALEKLGIHVRLVEVPTIKPLPEIDIINHLKECGAALTVEDHNIIGGLGSAVCEISCSEVGTYVERMGLEDVFCESGSAEELYQKYGLSKNNIVAQVKKIIERKREIL